MRDRATRRPIVLVGLGMMGATFAHAFLRAGYPVLPINRGDRLQDFLEADPLLVVVAVAEGDLHAVLATIPPVWKDRVMLLQNELLPRDWQAHAIETPTVACIWFEKKVDKPLKVLLPTVVSGPAADTVVSALAGIGIEARSVDEPTMLEELVLKNLYILTTNIAGLKVGGTTGALLADHQDLIAALAADVLRVQRALAPALRASDEELLERLAQALGADPTHGTMGRSAPARLARLLATAAELGVELVTAPAIGPSAEGSTR